MMQFDLNECISFHFLYLYKTQKYIKKNEITI
jgi:hypothetical protein